MNNVTHASGEGGTEANPLVGGPAVRADGEVVGRIARSISRRIQILRMLLILTIVAVHIPPAAWDAMQPTYSAEWFLFCKVFFNRIFSRSAVPALSAISGFLIFTGIQTVPYGRLMLSKCRSLLWPLLLWNGVVLSVILLVSHHPPAGIESVPRLDPINLLNELFGLAAAPANFPLAFLRDLFACAALSPLLWFVLRRAPWLGFVALAVIAIADIPIWIVQRQMMLLCFYLGGLVVLKKWDPEGLDRYAPYLIATYVICALGLTWLISREPSAILSQNTYAADAAYLGIMAGALKAFGVPTFWAMSSMLQRASFADFVVRSSRFTFLIYCAHMPVMQLLWRIWMRFVGDQNAPTYPVFYFAAAPLAVSLIVAGYLVLSRISPRLLAILEGGRIHRSDTLRA